MNAATAQTRGFTLIEMVITVAILMILASVAAPLSDLAVRRVKEHELRLALQEIREAIDNYKHAVDQGRIAHALTDSGYPKSLKLLAAGVPDQKRVNKAMIYFLRRIPRDPFNDDPQLAPEDTWGKRSYESSPDEPHAGDDVFDVYSLASGTAIDGTPYRSW